jgi:multidrug resistance efflux pump
MKRHQTLRVLASVSKSLLTLAVVIAGTHAARLLWQHYRASPWTRDGRVIAETVKIVPEVSGKIADISISDNQVVRKGDILFTIDRSSYSLALASTEATLATRRHELDLKRDIADRRRKLASNNAISTEEARMADSALEVAECSVTAAIAARDIAKLDLDRTVITSPVNGYITNLHLRPGDYASSGQPQFSIIDSDSFWVAGYFEETKLASLHDGDSARIDLMGGGSLHGTVQSISRGIADSTTATKGLAEVDPVFNWVRLAQRIPVRIRLDEIPQGIFLSSGMTCNVHLTSGGTPDQQEKSEGMLAAKAP